MSCIIFSFFVSQAVRIVLAAGTYFFPQRTNGKTLFPSFAGADLKKAVPPEKPTAARSHFPAANSAVAAAEARGLLLKK